MEFIHYEYITCSYKAYYLQTQQPVKISSAKSAAGVAPIMSAEIDKNNNSFTRETDVKKCDC